MDLQNDDLRLWNGSSYTAMASTGSMLGMNVYTSQNGTWNSKSTSGGSGTWTKPSGCSHVLVYVTGGGGGARVNDNSYRGAGGGGGATAIKWIDVSSVNSVNYTYGGGGGYARNGGRGGSGGTSSFGSYCTAGGGQGGQSDNPHQGGPGGNASGDGFAIQKWSNGNTYLWEYDAQDILIGTSNGERIRVDSGGNVGVGNR